MTPPDASAADPARPGASVEDPRTPRALLESLVAFPTPSHLSNLDLIDFADRWLAARGIASHRDYDATGEKAGLFAHVGPAVDGGVILSGHTDVVPVEGQEWTTDPWTLTEREGRLYGRGTCDMKGFDALALWAMGEAAERHRAGRLMRPLHIALTRDEEVGCLGAPPLIAAMEGAVPRAELAIIGEPTSMKVATAHKGVTYWRLTARGFEVHSSLQPTGVSAIMEMARVIAWANAVNEGAAPMEGMDVPSMDAFAPPVPTINCGVIRGGTAHNITAKDCTMDMSVRMMPGQTSEEWCAALDAVLAPINARLSAWPGAAVTYEVMAANPGLAPEDAATAGQAEALARRLTGDNGTHVVSFGTEAGQFQEGGYSAVLCGPGSIDQAHQPNEYIDIDQFEQGEAFMRRLLDHLCED